MEYNSRNCKNKTMKDFKKYYLSWKIFTRLVHIHFGMQIRKFVSSICIHKFSIRLNFSIKSQNYEIGPFIAMQTKECFDLEKLGKLSYI